MKAIGIASDEGYANGLLCGLLRIGRFGLGYQGIDKVEYRVSTAVAKCAIFGRDDVF